MTRNDSNQHAKMRRPNANNQTLPRGVPPMEGHYKKYNRNSTGKGLWGGKDNEVSQRKGVVWGNINVIHRWRV